jgi:nicotinate dehydrogenase subunit A
MATITVNGKPHAVKAEPDTRLLYVLRNEVGLNGPKFGCGLAQCGACTVHIDGRPMRSCMVKVSSVRGKITTIEGLGTPEKPHPLQRAFIEEQAAQCGYCTNGMIMTAAAFLVQTPKPTEQQIRTAMDGNLCRCGTHMRILRAVRKAAETGGAA